MSLFKKTLWLTDTHFGRSGNSQTANQDTLDFLDWAIDRGKSWGAETFIFGGDWHDNRHSLHCGTLHSSLDGMDKISAAFSNIYWLVGNHDLLYREKRDIASVEFARNIKNINIIRDPITIDDVTFLPWLVGDEHLTIKSLKSRYIFGHLELSGFKMNAAVVLPDSPHLLKHDQFVHQDLVFSGHFHIRQTEGRVIYTGNTFPFNFSDANDDARGIMLLEWGKDPIFENWSEQPLYTTVKLSELLAAPAQILRPKMTVRAAVDVQLQFEDAQDIRDALVEEYGIRKIELIHMASQDESDQDYKNDIEFKSVDQMVLDGIQSIESIDINPVRLAEIYRSLN